MTDIEGKVQTVLGPVAPAELGVTLTHEHMLIDLRVLYGGPDSTEHGDFYSAQVSIETLGPGSSTKERPTPTTRCSPASRRP